MKFVEMDENCDNGGVLKPILSYGPMLLKKQKKNRKFERVNVEKKTNGL